MFLSILLPIVNARERLLLLCRKGVPQPDNEEGIREGPIKVDNNIGKAWCRLATTTWIALLLSGNNNIDKPCCWVAKTTLISPVVGWQQQHL
jgi:hypothetical protein